MLRILKSLLIDNLGVFVPHTMRYKYPEGYEKAIKFQTWQLTNKHQQIYTVLSGTLHQIHQRSQGPSSSQQR